MWKAHFVDRSVQAALERVLHGEDASLVRVIRKLVPELTPTEVRESLRRANISVDFPVLSPATVPSGEEKYVEASQSEGRGEDRYVVRKAFWTRLLAKAREKTPLHATLSPSRSNWVGARAGARGLTLSYVVRERDAQIELYIDRGDEAENRNVFESLAAARDEVDRAFGAPLTWDPLPGKRAARISYTFFLGGYRDRQDKWPAIQEAMIEGMVRLEQALRPHLRRLFPESGSGAGRKAAQTRKSLKGFVFRGQSYPAKSWKDLFVEVCRLMHELHPAEFGQVLTLQTKWTESATGTPREQKWFSEDPAELLRPCLVPGTTIYAYTNLSAADCVRRSRRVIALLGHAPEELKVETE